MPARRSSTAAETRSCPTFFALASASHAASSGHAAEPFGTQEVSPPPFARETPAIATRQGRRILEEQLDRDRRAELRDRGERLALALAHLGARRSAIGDEELREAKALVERVHVLRSGRRPRERIERDRKRALAVELRASELAGDVLSRRAERLAEPPLEAVELGHRSSDRPVLERRASSRPSRRCPRRRGAPRFRCRHRRARATRRPRPARRRSASSRSRAYSGRLCSRRTTTIARPRAARTACRRPRRRRRPPRRARPPRSSRRGGPRPPIRRRKTRASERARGAARAARRGCSATRRPHASARSPRPRASEACSR